MSGVYSGLRVLDLSWGIAGLIAIMMVARGTTVRDYVDKNGFKGVVLGLSGGVVILVRVTRQLTIAPDLRVVTR